MNWETVACDLCGSTDSRFVFQVEDTNYHFEGIFSLVKCLSCGLVYLNPRPDVKAIGLYYPEDYRCFKNGGVIRTALDEKDPFVSTICQLGVKTGRLLDVGCGTGDFLVSAHLSGWQVAGVEPNEYARNRCNSRLGWEAVHSTLEEAAFPSQRFQVVTLWHVLEHLHSPKAALAEIHRILVPGGLVVIAVPNFNSLDRRIRGRQWLFIAAPRHLYHFTQDTLSRYLTQASFKMECLYFHPGMESLSATKARSARRLMLDWWQRPVARLPNAGDAPVGSDSAPVMAGNMKDRLIPTATQIVLYPLAWLIAKMRLGREITIYARRQ